MRVLSVAWAVQDDNIEYLKSQLTGAGVVIKNIAEYIGRKEESYMFIGCAPVNNVKIGNISYLNNGLNEEICNDNKLRLDTVIKSFENNLEYINPDIVNFHGEGDFICRCIEICKKRKIPFVVTIHLYVSKNLNIIGYEKAKEYWNNLLQMEGVYYIAVGTGLKHKILCDYSNLNDHHIKVIKNGTDYKAIPIESGLKKQLNIDNQKVLIFAGTINNRKNQMQAVRAYNLLPDLIKKKIKLLFCGFDRLDGQLQRYIQENNLKNGVCYLGAIPTNQMARYYSISDGYIMPSLAEGLSISELESLRFGLPQIMFSDSECSDDFADERVSVFAYERTDQALSDAIVKWFEKEWDKEYIIDFSNKFSMENVADEYIKHYKNIIEKI